MANPYQPPLDGNPPGARYLPDPQPELKVEAPPAPRLEIVTQWSRLDYAETFQGWRLTPERVAWIFRQADYGWAWQKVDMFEALVLNDGHTRGLFEQRMDELEVPWTLRPGDDRPASLQAATDLEAACRAWDMDGLIQFLQLQPFIGFSYAEVPWQTRSDGMQIPVDAVCVPHRRFAFDLQSRARLTSELNPYPGEMLERRPGSSWICAETKRWRKQTQAGLFRTAAFWCVFKRMSVRDWLIFAEKPLYRVYDTSYRLANIDAISDQQTAGVIMKLGGGFFLWAVIFVLFFKWSARHQEAERQGVLVTEREVLTWNDVQVELAELERKGT